jgi:hypothetical protein
MERDGGHEENPLGQDTVKEPGTGQIILTCKRGHTKAVWTRW